MSRSSPWGFLRETDKKKIVKAGFATPRGGAKNAYQNHVLRSNRVIIPWERLDEVDLEMFKHGYIVRLLPEQCFAQPGVLSDELSVRSITVGEQAFVLYRTRQALDRFPTLNGWKPRALLEDGEPTLKRSKSTVDTGEYVIRFSNPKREEGPPQGIFAPEYASEKDNKLSQAFLAWLLCQSLEAPYEKDDIRRLAEYLNQQDKRLLESRRLSKKMLLRDGIASCPLCERTLRYKEFHQMLDLSEAAGLANAGSQVQGATRSTIVNLFHLEPLLYGPTLSHKPDSVSWGHAVCNTLLGQRRCPSMSELQAEGQEIHFQEGTGGFMSRDEGMIRSLDGGVWVRLIERGHGAAPLIDEAPAALVEDEGEE